MGSGRVGARLAATMDAEGHAVTVIDKAQASLARLPASFSGHIVVGDATDEEVQKQAGVGEADVFVAVTQGDNRNIMAAQIAKEIFGVRKAVCRIYDPIRQEIFEKLSLHTFSPTIMLTRHMLDAIEREDHGGAGEAPAAPDKAAGQ